MALVGQPELAARLNDVKLRQLKQRIALRCELAALDLRETAAYITARVRVAGGNADTLFTREAVVAIHEHARGIPRTISVICDNALVNGFAADVKPVGRDVDHGGLPRLRAGLAAYARRPAPPVAATASVERRPDVSKDAARDAAAEADDRFTPMFSELTRRRRFSFF